MANGKTAQGFICPLSCTLFPSSCATGTGCAPVKQSDGGLFSDCEVLGIGDTTDPCGTNSDCKPGLGCDNGTCYPWCTQSSDCTELGATCQFSGGVILEGTLYGFCFVQTD